MRAFIFCLVLLPLALFAKEQPADIKQFLDRYANAEGLIIEGEVKKESWERFEISGPDKGFLKIPQGIPYTKKSYSNFVIGFEFKLEEEANSGLFLRYPGSGDGYAAMCELQILDDSAEKYKSLKPSQYHASAYGLAAAKRGFLKPLGEVNFQMVEVTGHRIRCWLNGEMVLDTDVSKTQSIFKEQKGKLRLQGSVALGGHAEGVSIRSFYIHELELNNEFLVKEVSDIFSRRCIACHNEQSKLINGGNLSMETKNTMLQGGKSGSALNPGSPKESLIYTSIIAPESERSAMPPVGRFQRLPEKEKELVKTWIEAGAPWSEGLVLSYQKPRVATSEIDEQEMLLVKKIREKILNNKNETPQDQSFEVEVAGSSATLTMVPIPAGEFLYKSETPGDEFVAELDGFWMSDKEVSWDLYSVFMEPILSRNKEGYPQDESSVKEGDVIIAQPSPPYHAMSFGMRVRRHPAIAMTQHAANKFCQWLSWQTGYFYRLPTEAEWEYAARAGNENKFPWGDELNTEEAKHWAWYESNSTGSYHRMGKKQANAWGLYDMLGNVMEWTLDGYVEDRKKTLGGSERVKNPWVKAAGPYPHVCKGGHWNAEIKSLAYGARDKSNPAWKASDPQSPKSIWYHTNVMWIGFRPIRSLEVPSAEEMYRYWNSGVAYD